MQISRDQRTTSDPLKLRRRDLAELGCFWGTEHIVAIFTLVHLHMDFAGTGICKDNVPIDGDPSCRLLYVYFPIL